MSPLTSNDKGMSVDTRKALDTQAIALMCVLCVIWGMQQVALKATASEITPILQISIRSGIAAVLVGLLTIRRRETASLADGTWRPGLVVGVLFALEYLFVGEGLRYTSAARAAVFLYTAPIFAALGLHWKLPSERLKPAQWGGIAVAFAGIVVAFLGHDLQGAASGDGMALWGDLLALAGGASYGATTVVIRCTSLSHAPATRTLLYQLLGAFVVLLGAAAVTGQLSIDPTPLALGALAFQTLIVSFASFLVWFWLLRHYLASRLGVFSFMTPVFGVVLGAVLLHEPVETSFLIGSLMVLAGIMLVSGYELIKPFAGARAKKAEARFRPSR